MLPSTRWISSPALSTSLNRRYFRRFWSFHTARLPGIFLPAWNTASTSSPKSRAGTNMSAAMLWLHTSFPPVPTATICKWTPKAILSSCLRKCVKRWSKYSPSAYILWFIMCGSPEAWISCRVVACGVLSFPKLIPATYGVSCDILMTLFRFKAALESQPTHPLLENPLFLVLAVGLYLLGLVLVLTSMFRLGITG